MVTFRNNNNNVIEEITLEEMTEMTEAIKLAVERGLNLGQ